MAKSLKKSREEWVEWIRGYGAGKFFDAFVEFAQDAESICTQCNQPIFLDIVEGGGIPDWKTEDGDYGCAILLTLALTEPVATSPRNCSPLGNLIGGR